MPVVALGGPGPDPDTWVAAKGRFAAAVADPVDREIAETFFNSCTRRMLGTVGVDPGVEYTGGEFPVPFRRLAEIQRAVYATRAVIRRR